MSRVRTPLTTLVGVGVALVTGLIAEPARADEPRVVIVQASNGFPGGESATDLARQKVTIVGERLRVLDEEHGWALYVSVPEQHVREVPSTQVREYVERPFAYYAKYRQDRARALEEQAAAFVQRRDRFVADLPDKATDLRALVTEYTHVGGDPSRPGQIRARVERFPGDRRVLKVLVDREERAVTVEHVQVRENNAQKPAFDLWVTKDVLLPVDLLAFWQQLGTFAPQVTALLPDAVQLPGPDGKSVRGTVIECRAVLDAGTLQREFRSQLLEVRTQEGAASDVVLPEGFAKKEPPTEPEAIADKVRCAMSGALIDRESATLYRHPSGRRYYVSSPEQRAALIQHLRTHDAPPFPSDEGGR